MLLLPALGLTKPLKAPSSCRLLPRLSLCFLLPLLTEGCVYSRGRSSTFNNSSKRLRHGRLKKKKPQRVLLWCQRDGAALARTPPAVHSDLFHWASCSSLLMLSNTRLQRRRFPKPVIWNDRAAPPCWVSFMTAFALVRVCVTSSSKITSMKKFKESRGFLNIHQANLVHVGRTKAVAGSIHFQQTEPWSTSLFLNERSAWLCILISGISHFSSICE